MLWAYSRADFAGWAATAGLTLAIGVEAGVISGVVVTLALYLWRASRPHAAIVGEVPGTGHHRNINRHAVITDPSILTIRIDESLTYLNARWLEDYVLKQIADRPDVQHLILMCSAVNAIDASGLESLEAIAHRLSESGVTTHLSEVKGPVMDKLAQTHFLKTLSGQIFLSQHEAFTTLLASCNTAATPEPTPAAEDPWLMRGLI
jgi:SulP family sulfate permease